MQQPDPNLVILSATLVFIGAAFVQAIVVPWAQAKTRRRERWEDTVSELTALVEDELKQALHEYTLAASVYLAVLDNRDNWNDEEMRNFRQSCRQAARVLDGCMSRVVILSDRLQTRRPRAPYWSTLRRHVDSVRLTVPMLKIVGDHVELGKRGDAANKARDDLATNIEPIRLLMRLPRPIRDPLWRLVGPRFVALGKPAIWVYRRLAEALAEAERRKVPAQRGPTAPTPSS